MMLTEPFFFSCLFKFHSCTLTEEVVHFLYSQIILTDISWYISMKSDDSEKRRVAERYHDVDPISLMKQYHGYKNALQRDLVLTGGYGTISWFKLDVGGPGNKNTIRN